MFVFPFSRNAAASRWRRFAVTSLWLLAANASGADPAVTSSANTATQSPATPALSLDRAMQLAAADAPQLAADAARITAAREDARRAGALPDPTLMLGIDDVTVTGPDALQLGADEATTRRIGFTQDWPSRRKREARSAEADARVDETVVMRSASVLAVERATARAWIARWSAETRLRLLIQLQGELQRAVAIADARLRGGEGNSADVLATRAARVELDNEISAATAEVAAARAGLVRWLGPPGEATLSDAPDFATLAVPAATLRASIDRHALLQVWDARARVADSAITRAQADKRPDLSIGLSYGARSGLTDMLSLELGVGLPVFARNRQDRDIAARRAERDAVAADHEAARREQREALEQALARWQGKVEETARYETTLLPLASDRVSVSLAAYGGGGEVQPWLDARRDEIQARLRYVATLDELATLWATLATLLPEEGIR